jgi:acyl transferase domain-containing protein
MQSALYCILLSFWHCDVLLHQLTRYGTALVAPLNGELALFALQYALAKTWQKLGLEPSVVIGDRVGEYAAASVAGALSLRDAIRILQARRALAINEDVHVSLLVPRRKKNAFFNETIIDSN